MRNEPYALPSIAQFHERQSVTSPQRELTRRPNLLRTYASFVIAVPIEEGQCSFSFSELVSKEKRGNLAQNPDGPKANNTLAPNRFFSRSYVWFCRPWQSN